MLLDYKNGVTSVVLRVKLRDSSATTGAGLTALTFSSAGLVISTIADNESAATAYTQAGSTVETITTLGTYAAPTATKCRFKEVDATNHKGVYEIQIADARFAVSNAKSLMISISGAANLAQCDVVVPLRSVDPYDGVRGGMTALPNVAAGANGGLPLGVDASGRVDVLKINGTSQTARDIGASVLLSPGVGTGQLDFTAGVVKANAVQLLGTAWLTPGVAGTPDVNAKLVGGQTASASGTVTFPNATLASTTNITAGTISTVNALAANAVNANALATDAVQEIRNAITGGAYALDTDANGRIRIVDGTGTGELDTASGLVKISGTKQTLDALNDLSAAAVNAEVVDALATDTYTEPSQGTPGATLSLAAKINYLYTSWRNLKTNDGDATKLYASDGTTVIAKQTTASAAGTVSKDAWITGP